MSNSLRGMMAGLVATLVLSGILMLKSHLGLWPELNIIRLLVSLGSIQTVAAWMDHFIVGVVVWGLLFGAFDAAVGATRAYWLKGLDLRRVRLVSDDGPVHAARESRVSSACGSDRSPPVVTLGLHLIYGARARGDLRRADGLLPGQGAGETASDAVRLRRSSEAYS